MDFDPKIRFRPWQTALLGVVLATGLVFVFAPEVSLLGTSAEPPSGPPTPTTVVPSAPLTTTGPEPQEIVPGPAADHARAGAADDRPAPPTARRSAGRARPGRPAAQERRRPASRSRPTSNLTALSFNIHSALGTGGRWTGPDRDRDRGAGTPTSSCCRRSTAAAPTPTTPTSRATYAQRARDGRRVRGERATGRGPSTASRPCRSTRSSSQSNTHLPNDPSTREDQQRGVLTRRSRWATASISVYNTHLQHMKHYDGLRMRQMEAITGLMRADPLPKILGGDLNSGPTSAVLSTARTVVKDAWDAVGVGSGPARPSPPEPARTDRLPPVLRPAGAPDLRGALLRDLRPPRRTHVVPAAGLGATHLRAGLRRTTVVVRPGRPRSHESSGRTAPSVRAGSPTRLGHHEHPHSRTDRRRPGDRQRPRDQAPDHRSRHGRLGRDRRRRDWSG